MSFECSARDIDRTRVGQSVLVDVKGGCSDIPSSTPRPSCLRSIVSSGRLPRASPLLTASARNCSCRFARQANLYAALEPLPGTLSTAEGAYEFCARSPLVENNESGFSVSHCNPAVPRAFAVLPHRYRGGTTATAANGLAALAWLRIPGWGFAVGVTENLANADRGRLGRIRSL
jgi:hypothetical protein